MGKLTSVPISGLFNDFSQKVNWFYKVVNRQKTYKLKFILYSRQESFFYAHYTKIKLK